MIYNNITLGVGRWYDLKYVLYLFSSLSCSNYFPNFAHSEYSGSLKLKIQDYGGWKNDARAYS
jgi:hypothetical protein